MSTPFGIELRRLRKIRGVKQNELATMIGMDSGNLSGIENGHRNAPEEFVRDQIAAALNLSEEERTTLEQAAVISTSTFRLKKGASPKEFRLAAALCRGSGRLSDIVLDTALFLIEYHNNEVRSAERADAAFWRGGSSGG